MLFLVSYYLWGRIDLNKLIIAVLVGLLIFTACDENTENDGNKVVLPTAKMSENNIINFNEINISGIKIKDFNTGQESIFIKEGIIREFRDFFTGLKLTKTEESCPAEYEAEILDVGEPVLKIRISGRMVEFSEKVMLGNTIIEKGNYEVGNRISQNIQHFNEGKVLDPQNIEASANIYLPEAEFKLDIIDKGNAKINQLEVYPKLYGFVTERFCNYKFEVLEYEKIFDYESMNRQKQIAMNNSRAMIIDNSGNYIKVESNSGYDESISASNIVLSEYKEKPGIYQILADKMKLCIKVNDEFVKGFEDVFNTNSEKVKVLMPGEIEDLVKEKKPYYLDYIWKNLGIESWYGDESIRLERQKMNLGNERETYNVLSFYQKDSALRLLFFKEDKYIDYIDFGGKLSEIGYRSEKVGDKIFIVGKSCRGYGTGMGRYFEEWYILTDKGKKLVVSLPYDDFVQGPIEGYNLKAKSIKLNTKGDILTADYNLNKFYLMGIDIGDENCEITVEVPKKVVFKWNNEKFAFVSEFAPNDMGMTEIPPESDEITGKCTNILKNKYKQLTNAMLLHKKENNDYIKENRKRSWEIFLNDCEDCNEKAELLKLLNEK